MSTSDLIRHGTYNLFNFSKPRTSEEKERYWRLVEATRALGVHSLSVQEVLGVDAEEAGQLLRQFADDTCLRCMTAPNPRSGAPAEPAIAASQHGHLDKSGAFRGNYHVGLLWSPEIQPVPGGWRAYNGLPDFWHALATQLLDFGGTRLKIGSFQGDPFRADWRFNEARRVVSAYLGQSGLLGGDFNGLASDLRAGRRFHKFLRWLWPWAGPDYYDPEPYSRQRHDLLEFQIQWRDKRPRRPKADRRAGEVLRRQGLLDAAAVADVPWQATCGHWPGDVWGLRRIDTNRVTRDIAPAVVSHESVFTDLTRLAADHLPIVTAVDNSRIEHSGKQLTTRGLGR
ncbi:hypothetical protein ACWGCC_10070 [Streptomyces nigrescens]